MAIDKKDSKNSEDGNWEFELDTSSIELIDPIQSEEKKPKKGFNVEEPKLKIDYKAKPKMSTREEMYKSLEKSAPDDKLEKIDDIVPIKIRAFSFIIDNAFNLLFAFIASFLSPYILIFCNYYNQKKHLVWTLKPQYQLPYIELIVFLILFFIFNIIFTVFLNATIGKLIFKLRVRGEFDNIVTFEQILYREGLIKPLSVIFIIGLLFPFFDKEKRAIHDRITKTRVVHQ